MYLLILFTIGSIIFILKNIPKTKIVVHLL